jgi:hypothetical protein
VLRNEPHNRDGGGVNPTALRHTRVLTHTLLLREAPELVDSFPGLQFNNCGIYSLLLTLFHSLVLFILQEKKQGAKFC